MRPALETGNGPQGRTGRWKTAAKAACRAFGVAWLVITVSEPNAAKLVHDSLPGPLTRTMVRFSVALPDDYGVDKGPYPVIYHLHGIGGNEEGNQVTAVPKVFEEARKKGLIGPVILVFPNGLTNSFWADAKDNSRQVETQILQELMPDIDSAYRTRTDRAGRFIQGFSMGGFGAAKFMAKFPDRFRACTLYDGALLDWKTLSQRHADIARDMFANDSAYWAQYNPYDQLRRNAAVLGADYPVKMAVGALLNENRAFRDSLKAHGLQPAYSETGCAHVLPCLLEAEGENTARLYGSLLAATPTALGVRQGVLQDVPQGPPPGISQRLLVQRPQGRISTAFDLAGRLRAPYRSPTLYFIYPPASYPGERAP